MGFASSLTAEEEYFEYDMVCKPSFLKEFKDEFELFKADMAAMKEAGDLMLPEERNAVRRCRSTASTTAASPTARRLPASSSSPAATARSRSRRPTRARAS